MHLQPGDVWLEGLTSAEDRDEASTCSSICSWNAIAGVRISFFPAFLLVIHLQGFWEALRSHPFPSAEAKDVPFSCLFLCFNSRLSAWNCLERWSILNDKLQIRNSTRSEGCRFSILPLPFDTIPFGPPACSQSPPTYVFCVDYSVGNNNAAWFLTNSCLGERH